LNVWMYRNPIVQQNIQQLKDTGVHFVEPEEGWLACGDEGAGRLAPPEEIAARALSLLSSGKALNGKHVVVTAGPTWEALDPVRVLTNRSSGKMGYAIAEEAAGRGARVTLISGPTQLLPPLNVDLVRVESAEQMKNAVLEVFDSADYVIKTAAVSDYRPAEVLSSKRKKTGKPEMIALEPTEDVLALLGRRKQKQILVGFCAETENLESNARGKLERKNLDFIVANLVSSALDPFQSEQNQVLILDRNGGRQELPLQKKPAIASSLWDILLERANELHATPAGKP
jgi:phosphopantothenoylcysteine decarboxylase / phosphopantothenate---cysteine ligase